MTTQPQPKNLFPRDVFHPEAEQYINALEKHYDMQRPFVGLCMLGAFSSAVGTAYAIERPWYPTYMNIWGCVVGGVAVGKSMVMDEMYKPLQRIQDTMELGNGNFKTVIFHDLQVLILSSIILPSNPKGITLMPDELMEWQHFMRKKQSQQFWLSAFAASSYTEVRKSTGKLVGVPRAFVNVITATNTYQPYGLKTKLMDSHSINRTLYAMPEVARIAMPDMDPPQHIEGRDKYTQVIQQLYRDLPVDNGAQPPKLLLLTAEALKVYTDWKQQKSTEVNQIKDRDKQEIHAGILGKMSEYALRFAGLLSVADMAYDGEAFSDTRYITFHEMERAIRLADYFTQTALDLLQGN